MNFGKTAADEPSSTAGVSDEGDNDDGRMIVDEEAGNDPDEEDMDAMLGEEEDESSRNGGPLPYRTSSNDDSASVDDADIDLLSGRQNLKPSQLVAHLDDFIVGQGAAKKSVAVALRNRWRRHRVRPTIRQDITPKNILMVGPTGCGKTEIARRLALLTDSPFLKVEATKFTEVGFYGKDVESIIKDLVRTAIAQLRNKKKEKVAKEVGEKVEQMLLNALQEAREKAEREAAGEVVGGVGMGRVRRGAAAALPQATAAAVEASIPVPPTPKAPSDPAADRAALARGDYDATFIEIDMPPKGSGSSNGGGGLMDLLRGGRSADEDDDFSGTGRVGGGGGGGGAFVTSFKILSGPGAGSGGIKGGSGLVKRRVTIGEARPALIEFYTNQRVRTKDLAKSAIAAVESDGIVFIDEIDKICSSATGRRFNSSADASAEGVQRDLLPLVEGTTVTTPHGPVQTDHILFIASGAFHNVAVSDMLPELQGRFPIRVELKPLTEEDFYRILTVPKTNLIRQQVALLKTDGLELEFSDGAIREIARVAFEANRTLENIGARRLNTVIQRIMDEYSFTAADQPTGTKIVIDAQYVREKIKPLMQNTDLSKYVL